MRAGSKGDDNVEMFLAFIKAWRPSAQRTGTPPRLPRSPTFNSINMHVSVRISQLILHANIYNTLFLLLFLPVFGFCAAGFLICANSVWPFFMPLLDHYFLLKPFVASSFAHILLANTMFQLLGLINQHLRRLNFTLDPRKVTSEVGDVSD